MIYVFMILFDLTAGRMHPPTPKMNMNFSRHGKLSNGFSILSPHVLLPCDPSEMPITFRFYNMTIRTLGLARRINYRIIIEI